MKVARAPRRVASRSGGQLSPQRSDASAIGQKLFCSQCKIDLVAAFGGDIGREFRRGIVLWREVLLRRRAAVGARGSIATSFFTLCDNRHALRPWDRSGLVLPFGDLSAADGPTPSDGRNVIVPLGSGAPSQVTLPLIGTESSSAAPQPMRVAAQNRREVARKGRVWRNFIVLSCPKKTDRLDRDGLKVEVSWIASGFRTRRGLHHLVRSPSSATSGGRCSAR